MDTKEKEEIFDINYEYETLNPCNTLHMYVQQMEQKKNQSVTDNVG